MPRGHVFQARLGAAVRMEHHEAGRKRRLDQFQRRRSRRSANAAHARRLHLSVSAATGAVRERMSRSAGYSFDFTAPVGSLHASTVSVLSYPLRIVPPVALTPQPEQYVVVETRQPKQFDVFARVHSFAQTPSKVSVGVEVPSGWKAPAAESVEFSGTGDRLVHLTVMPPAKIAAGNYELKAYAKRGAKPLKRRSSRCPRCRLICGARPPPYPCTRSPSPCRSICAWATLPPTTTTLSRIRCAALGRRCRNARRERARIRRRSAALTPSCSGMRAYELRADVVASNSRLLDYAADGGTLVVQDERPASGTRSSPLRSPRPWARARASPTKMRP
jgi:hypothetical protein